MFCLGVHSGAYGRSGNQSDTERAVTPISPACRKCCDGGRQSDQVILVVREPSSVV